MSKKISLIITSLLIITLGFWITLSTNFPAIQPPTVIYYYFSSLFHPHAQMKKEVIGFLPYWRLSDIQYLHPELISEINYFSLYADEKGNIIKTTDSKPELSWQNWQNEEIKNLAAKTQILGGKFSLSISAHKNKTIEDILDNESHMQNLTANILTETSAYHLDAVNIDFEYLGNPDKKYQQKFTKLIKNISSQIQSKSPKTKIYISLPPLAARTNNLFDLKNLNQITDKFIIMSYDYYSAGSDVAGPTAPINGFKENKFFFDITTTYSDYLLQIPKNKIIMGIPYYGRDWAVQDDQKNLNKTLAPDDPENYSAVNTYAYSRDDKNLIPENCQWDDYALQTTCIYIDNQTQINHQVWIEDNKSIEIKFNFANDRNLSGIAIWSLGFDKNYPDLWNLIKTKFTRETNHITIKNQKANASTIL